jgi:hypothetical protein
MMSIEALLQERDVIMARLAQIDSILGARGVQPVRKGPYTRHVRAAIKLALASGPKSVVDIARITKQTPNAVRQMMHMMTKANEAVRVGWGKYALPER